ncbi:MAG: DUF6483 family protein [Ignavibacteriaceae bacterium]
MIRHDYIMMLIEQLSVVLVKILFNKDKENYKEAAKEAESALSGIVGLDYNMLNSLSAEDIISLLNISDDTSGFKCIVAAKLLKEIADIKELSSNSGGDYKTYIKILTLYLEGILKTKVTSTESIDFTPDIEDITKRLSEYEFPPGIKHKLFRFYELTSKFDKAENLLFELKIINYDNIKTQGIQFYNNLQKLNDTELAKGKLSRNEIKEGLAEFLK